MLRVPPEFQSTISAFSKIFSRPVWIKAQLLLCAAICCPGSRTICNLLRAANLSDDKKFHKYHRFLSRDKWSALSASTILLLLLVKAFLPPDAPLVFGIDETIERRWGGMITKRAIYRDAVRSSGSHLVKCSGLRWMSMMLLTPLPWLEKGCWALPVLTALCPSSRYWQERVQNRVHKPLTTWAAQILGWIARTTSGLKRPVFLVGDGSYATYSLMTKAVACKVGLIVRMKMNSCLYHLQPPPVEGKRGRKPKKGNRILGMKARLTDKRIKWREVTFSDWYGAKNKTMLITTGLSIWSSGSAGEFVHMGWVLVKDPEGKMKSVLIGCTDLNISAEDVVRFFVRRWQVEVTFAEVRRHLGVETQRQWSDLAIERSTPLLMGLVSIICLLAKPLFEAGKMEMAATAWYDKTRYTFSDVLRAVRQQIWAVSNFSTTGEKGVVEKLKAKVRYFEQLLTQAVA
jgi:hypothetical protein